MSDTKKWYVCDPEKNVDCRKRGCVINCRITSKEECAVRDSAGKPIEVIPRELLKEKMLLKKLFQ